MAFKKERVKLGVDAEGAPIYAWIEGKTQEERDDRKFLAYLKSGRAWDFPEFQALVGSPAQTAGAKPATETIKTDFCTYAWDCYHKYKERRIAESSKSRETSALNVLCRHFKGWAIEDIGVSDIQDWMNSRAENEIAKSTINDQLKVLRGIFKNAIEDGLVAKNPAASDRLTNAGYDSEGTIPLPLDEFKRIVDLIPTIEDPTKQRMLALFALTGMRRSEVLGLRWEDIDFDSKKLHVRRAITYPKGTPHIKSTKSKAGNRFIPIPDILLACLTKYRQAEGYVIAGKDGEPFASDSAYDTVYKSLLREIESPETTALVFRSTYATMQAAAGVEPKTLQVIMGHSDFKITMNVYAKLEASRLDANRNVLQDFLGKHVA